jgi:hypothetical protein
MKQSFFFSRYFMKRGMDGTEMAAFFSGNRLAEVSVSVFGHRMKGELISGAL